MQLAVDMCPNNAGPFGSHMPASCVDRSERKAVRCCPDSGASSGCRSVCAQSGTAGFDGACQGSGLGGRRISPITGICPVAATYDEALAECTAQPGYHLCTAQEYEDTGCCGSGCGYDYDRVWV